MRLSRTALAAAFASGMLALALCGTALTGAPRAGAARGRHPRGPSFVARDVNHVLATGQSLSVGVCGAPALTTAQPYHNLMLEPGVMRGGATRGGSSRSSSATWRRCRALRESRDEARAREPAARTTCSSAFTASAARRTRVLKKGTSALREWHRAGHGRSRSVARASGLAYDVTAVTYVHGGGDHVDKNTQPTPPTSPSGSTTSRRTSRPSPDRPSTVPMFLTQCLELDGVRAATSPIPLAQLARARRAPGQGARRRATLRLPYGRDGVHLTNEGYRHMGEDYARRTGAWSSSTAPWEPLRPKTHHTRRRRHHRALPRARAAARPRHDARDEPGRTWALEYADDGPGRPTITSVALTGADTVAITLSAEPTARTAGSATRPYRACSALTAGLSTGARGNLRDSDATPSRSGYTLYDWCVHFDEPVPVTAARRQAHEPRCSCL